MPKSLVPVFDIGGVLIDWDPRHLYRDLIPDEAEREWFLAEVCSPAWNRQMDAGMTFADGVAQLTARFPEHAALIAAFDRSWSRMVPGALTDTVTLLKALQDQGHPVYAITNFSVEKFAECQVRFPFLADFVHVTVSGAVRAVKPDPAIFRRFLDDTGLEAADCLYTDDMADNVTAAQAIGMRAVRFTDAAALRTVLQTNGLLPAEA